MEENKMPEKFLPIGTVVLLKNGKKEVMITSYCIFPNNTEYKEGQEVKQGDVIGKSGTSLYTTNLGESLHFEVVKNDKHLNPEKIYTKSVESL